MHNFILAFTIFAKYLTTDYCLGAEHDQIFVYVTVEQIPPESEDGKVLVDLGWFIQDDGWSRFV